MKKIIFSLVLLAASAGAVFGASVFDITFPVAELGNCADRVACKTYCDDAANQEACIAFAEKYGLTTKSETDKARKLAGNPGPGGCRGEECKTYCEDESHFNECVSFAEREGFMTKEEAELARKLHNQQGPGGCRGEQCREYCEDDAHHEECAKFAEEHGLAAPNKGEEGGEEGSVPRMRGPKDFKNQPLDSALGKPGPGGCEGKEACHAYCENPDHREECLRFAEEHHLLTSAELARAKKGLEAAKKGGPGGCRGEKACREYCADPEHSEVCIDFAVENGFMSQEDAKRAKKFRAASSEGGPGGCRGEECRKFCEDQKNRETCFAFAKEHGVISEEETRHFEAGKKLNDQVRQNGGPGGCHNELTCHEYCSDPAHSEECITFAAIKGGVTPEDAKSMLEQFRNSGGKPGMRQGFDTEGGFGGQPSEFGHPGDFGPQRAFPQGPGGCTSPEECIKYCSDPANRDICAKFGPAAGGPPPGGTFRQAPRPGESFGGEEFEGKNFGNDGMGDEGFGNGSFPESIPRQGPGGCAGREECEIYCSKPEHQADCKRGTEGTLQDGGAFQNNFPSKPHPSSEPRSSTRPMPPQFQPQSGEFPTGPGGCKGPEECKIYCQEHPEACNPSGQRGLEGGQFPAYPAGGQQPGAYPYKPEGGFPPGEPHPEGNFPSAFPRPEGVPPPGGDFQQFNGSQFPQTQQFQAPIGSSEFQGGIAPQVSPPPSPTGEFKGSLWSAFGRYLLRVLMHPPM